jgi:hypothetical protein
MMALTSNTRLISQTAARRTIKLKRLLNGMLTQENRDAGFNLIEMPDGEIQLRLKWTLMHKFEDTATAASINEYADKLREEYSK